MKPIVVLLVLVTMPAFLAAFLPSPSTGSQLSDVCVAIVIGCAGFLLYMVLVAASEKAAALDRIETLVNDSHQSKGPCK